MYNKDNSQCSDPRSTFFIQYECNQSAAEAKLKWTSLCIISSFVALISLSLILFKYYVKETAINKELKYDLNTVTVDDFAVEMEISTKQNKQFLEQKYEPSENNSVALQSKKYLKDEIE